MVGSHLLCHVASGLELSHGLRAIPSSDTDLALHNLSADLLTLWDPLTYRLRKITDIMTDIIKCGLSGVYIYIYGTPAPRPILSQNLLVFALFCCFLLCLNVCFFGRLFYIFKKLCRVVKTLPPLIKLFSFNRKGFLQNLEKTKKPKNQNFLEKFWFQVKRCFFFVFLEFFCFFLV